MENIYCKNCNKPTCKENFCNRSCCMKFYNKNKIKAISKTKDCNFCSAKFEVKRQKNGQFLRTKKCPDCSVFIHHNMTKGDLFNSRKNWQSARSSIQKHARKIYAKYNKPLICCICNYDNHVEIAHVKSVSEFHNDSLISEINNIDNLIPLCPNHHWEYDNGFKKTMFPNCCDESVLIFGVWKSCGSNPTSEI